MTEEASPLDKEEVFAILDAYRDGEDRDITEAEAAKLLEWAAEVRIRSALLQGLISGEYVVRRRHGDWEFQIAKD